MATLKSRLTLPAAATMLRTTLSCENFMLPELIEVITTTAEQSDAQAIAAMLVEKRLAACTQVSGPIESNYWWNDRIETAKEWQVTVKTRGDMYADVEAAIRGVLVAAVDGQRRFERLGRDLPDRLVVRVGMAVRD